MPFERQYKNRTTVKSGKRILFVMAAVLAMSSCTKVYIQEEIAADRQIIVFSSIGGVGDNGYNDLITKGLTRVYMEYKDVSMSYLTPESMEQADSLADKWIRESSRTVKHTLLVLGASDYRGLVEEMLADAEFTSDNEVEILTFEIPELPQSQNCIKAYSFMIPMYNASYQAGVYAAQNGYNHPLVWLAYQQDALLIKARDGFVDGYKSVSDSTIDIRYLSDDWSGYAMDGEAYIQMEEISGKYDFVFPVMGGSNMGIFRYLRENADGPRIVGMDVDQSVYSAKIVGNIIKHIDELLFKIIRDWMNGIPIEHYRDYDTQSGYIEWSPVAD